MQRPPVHVPAPPGEDAEAAQHGVSTATTSSTRWPLLTDRRRAQSPAAGEEQECALTATRPPQVLAGCLAKLPTPSQASRHGADFPLVLQNPSHTAKETKEAEIISYRRLLLLTDMGEMLQA